MINEEGLRTLFQIFKKNLPKDLQVSKLFINLHPYNCFVIPKTFHNPQYLLKVPLNK